MVYCYVNKSILDSIEAPNLFSLQVHVSQNDVIKAISIVSCSDELKELEAKLRAGYVNRERAAQLAEKQADRTLEKVQ